MKGFIKAKLQGGNEIIIHYTQLYKLGDKWRCVQSKSFIDHSDEEVMRMVSMAQSNFYTDIISIDEDDDVVSPW